MAPSGRILLISIVLILLVHLTEPKDGYQSLSRSRSRRSSTTRRTYRTYTYTTYSSTGSYGRGLSWWQICLIIGGIVFAFIIIYICVRACRNQQPESDTPGIHTTRDQIQLRDHQTIDPNTNYHDGRVIPPPPHMQQQTPAYQPQPMATAPPPSYDDALDISKEPIGDGAVDKWEDDPMIDRKDFGVI